ncbi:MAG: DNA-protecting protein DprA [Ignavibacteriales bacterium]|nr:DNA-protecting protein DprA [Ignavibacteriales bacterium]
MLSSEISFWIALTQIPRWGNVKVNTLLQMIFEKEKIGLEDFFSRSVQEWKEKFGLSEVDCENFTAAKNELPNYSFIAEDLLSQGFEIIPITSSDYSSTLKENLNPLNAPPLLYIKGNKKILQESSLAIVGSRDASEISLQFTDKIARLASKQYKVVVSGFAKGVDKQALDSSLKYKGQSIIVLPQGISTFGSGITKYYSQIIEGDVLVLSTFFPKSPWSVQLAMARNPIIYGLAKEIYVAESGNEGGTWSGVLDGLRKKRNIFVRKPEAIEKNANNILIQKGAIAVDFDGNSIPFQYEEIEQKQLVFAEPKNISKETKYPQQENLFK